MEDRKRIKMLVDHIKSEHRPSAVSAYLKEIVYGGNDGIVTTFAVVAGFAGAQSVTSLPPAMVLLFGFANLFADGLSMGLGNFLSLRSEQDLYKQEKRKERTEIRERTQDEELETVMILKSKGFSERDAKQLTKLYKKNEDYWTEFMMKYELEMQNPFDENPYLTALATFASFVAFGLIPLIPYLLFGVGQNTFFISGGFTFLSLIILGVIRWRLTRETIIRSVGQVVFIGSIAAVVAYLVGTFFRT